VPSRHRSRLPRPPRPPEVPLGKNDIPPGERVEGERGEDVWPGEVVAGFRSEAVVGA
jgi:hypothetical protein